MNTRRAKRVRRKKGKGKLKTIKKYPKSIGGADEKNDRIRGSYAEQIELKFREKILDLVTIDSSTTLEHDILKLYEDFVTALKNTNDLILNENKGMMELNTKNIINNLIEYAESVFFIKSVTANVTNPETKKSRNSRREMFIDRFTRFNTKPYLDPYLDRIISTFWPEFDSIQFKPSQKNILQKTRKYVSDFYDNTPVYDKTQENNEQKPGTYSHRVMRQYDDYNGDSAMLTDAFGVEETINMLMHTGSNLSWAENRQPTYTEEYEQKEKYDVSKMIAPPLEKKE